MAAKWYDFVWPMGGVVSASLLIAWATEIVSFFMSRGLAFALLAFLQVLPEFSVEAVITVSAARDPTQLQYVTANFTGANRLIAGLFVPMTFYMAAWRSKRAGRYLQQVTLPPTSSIEVVFLVIPTVYLLLIPLRGRLTPVDAVLLILIYVAYLFVVQRLPAEAEESHLLPLVPRTIRRWPPWQQWTALLAMFAVGGYILYHSVEPFYHNTLELGAFLGVSAYFLLQWIAPFLSEFPEFITILYWGRTGRAQLGITNAVSSNINQLTLLIAMLPFAYAYGGWSAFGVPQWEIPFDGVQRVEILLTGMQMLFAAIILLNLRLERREAHTLLGLWVVQLTDPLVHPYFPSNFPSPFGTGAYIREWLILVYFVLCWVEIARARGRMPAFVQFARVWREHIAPPAKAARQRAA